VEKSYGLRWFYVKLDSKVILQDVSRRMPTPENTDGQSTGEFLEKVLIPYAREYSRQAVAAFGIDIKAPIAGFWEAVAILQAKDSWERAWLTAGAERAQEMGSDFTAAFFYFLNRIADANHADKA